MENIYRVPSVNAEKLYQEIAKLNKRAKRNGLAPIAIVEVGTEIVTPEDGKAPYVVCLLQIVGESPIIAGWQFLAMIEHIGGDTIIRAMPGIVAEGELAGYRGAAAHCQHCKAKVYRKYTAILKNEAGEYKQVGKSCLRDFTGHKSVEALATIAEQLQKALDEAGEYDDDDMSGFGGGKSLIPMTAYLAYVVASIRKYGFVSKKQVEESYDGKVSTAADALMNLYPAKGYAPDYRPTEADKKEAETALEWARNYQGPMNDYMHNLCVTCKLNFLDYQHTGIAASLISAYHKAMGDIKERGQKKVSEWQGQQGDKLTIKRAFVKKMTVSQSYYGKNQSTFFYVLVDVENNAYIYSASKPLMEEGRTYDLIGTVKDHGTHNGTKQTVVTRCKVTQAYELAA